MNLSTLNDAQRESVTTTEGNIRVVAGAGSGKTRALVYRYAYIVNELGVPPSNILCLTFTNKAAQEMRHRIAQLIPGSAAADFVSTIHGFCVKFLREEIYRIGYPENYQVLDEEDVRAIVKETLLENNIERKVSVVGDYMEELGCFKAKTPYIARYMLPNADIPEIEKNNIFVQMLLKQRKFFALDFDDLEFFTLYILKNFPDCRRKWQERMQYVMVDEVQDCNGHDWELFQTLSDHYGNLFVVGDGDQAIYEWRGAEPDLFINYRPDKDIYLKENFRSVPNIVCLADCIIGNNRNRLPRTSITMRGAGGIRTQHYHCKDEKNEAETLVKEIKRLHGSEGLRWRDIAVLYRASYLSRGIEQAFMQERIPYTIWGGLRFFERKEIKDALSYLRLIALDDDISFKRIANVPSRKIGRQTMARIASMAAANHVSMYKALRDGPRDLRTPASCRFIEVIEQARKRMKSVPISDLLNGVLEQSGILAMYRTDSDEERLENLQELIKSIRLYEEENREEDYTIETYLQDIALYTNADYRKDDEKVRIMTVHQSKGLDFPAVFIYGLNEGIFPSHRTIRDRGAEGLEEERRLMYVACTRAMDRLHFTESEGYNVQNSQGKYPSRFIREARDTRGNLYDTVGRFDPSLWEGTDALIAKVEAESGGEKSRLETRKGQPVRHPVFGSGVVEEMDEETGIATVRFKKLGVRKLRADILKRAEEDD